MTRRFFGIERWHVEISKWPQKLQAVVHRLEEVLNGVVESGTDLQLDHDELQEEFDETHTNLGAATPETTDLYYTQVAAGRPDKLTSRPQLHTLLTSLGEFLSGDNGTLYVGDAGTPVHLEVVDGNLTVRRPTSSATVIIDSQAGFLSELMFQKAGIDKWRLDASPAVDAFVIHNMILDEPAMAIGASTKETTFFAGVKVQTNEGTLQLPSLSTAQRDALVGVVRGELIYNSTTLAIEGYFEINGADTGVWGIVAAFPIFAQGIRTTAATTPIPAINTIVAVVGALTASGDEIGFTLDGTGLIWTYTGPTRGKLMTVTYTGSVQKAQGQSPETVRFHIRENGADVGLSIQISCRQNEPSVFTAKARVIPNNGDTYQLFVENLDATTSLTINEYVGDLIG